MLAIEGPDGSGKTSIAQGLAERLGGKYVKPFEGTVGLLIRWLHERHDYSLANQIALASVARIVDEHANVPWLIFDRHWVSVLAFTSPEFHPTWMPAPPTIVCLADRNIISQRLTNRGATAEELTASAGIVERFHKLVEDFGLTVLDTSQLTAEAAVEQLLRHELLAKARGPASG